MKNEPVPGLLPRLSVMMFLQYAIWGAWLPILAPFLLHRKFSEGEIGAMFAVGAVGAIVAPFVAGQIADRWFATQKFLGVLHLVGAALMWQLASIESYTGFLVFSLCYSLLYCPTMPLTNSLAFHHLPDASSQFGKVRLWGTIGWIVVGIAMGQWLLHVHTPQGAAPEIVKAAQDAGRADAFKLASILGALMGVYCFMLPDTPPQRGTSSVAIVQAFGSVARNPLLTLFLLTIPISCIHQFYFVHTSGLLSAYQTGGLGFADQVFGVGGGGLMTIGQMSEIVVLASIPWFARRFSRKSILVVGVLAYALRMALFAYFDALPFAPLATLVAGVALHGPVFGCFIFLAFMIIDEEAPTDVRASTQGLYNLVIVGIGVLVGSPIATAVLRWARAGAPEIDFANVEHTRALFSVPMWASLAVLVLLVLFYPGGKRVPAVAPARA